MGICIVLRPFWARLDLTVHCTYRELESWSISALELDGGGVFRHFTPLQTTMTRKVLEVYNYSVRLGWIGLQLRKSYLFDLAPIRIANCYEFSIRVESWIIVDTRKSKPYLHWYGQKLRFILKWIRQRHWCQTDLTISSATVSERVFRKRNW